MNIDVVSNRFREVIKVAKNLENTVLLNLGLGYHSSVIEDIVHDVLWLVVDRGSLDFERPMPYA